MSDPAGAGGERAQRLPFRRSVVSRVLWSYALVVLTFAVVAGWSALGLRSDVYRRDLDLLATCRAQW